MPGNRAAAQAFILKYIYKIAPLSDNVKIYKNIFAVMTDKDFGEFIDDLESGKKFLVLIAPNFTKTGITVENNLDIAEELKHNFFERIWIEGNEEIPTYLTPIPYMILDLPNTRASQMLTKKISVPKHNKVIDSLTGQPTGESKGAKISYPELQVASAMGLNNCMIELMKYRGGDARGGAAMAGMLSKYGRATIDNLSHFASGVESTFTFKTFLTAAHLKNTLNP